MIQNKRSTNFGVNASHQGLGTIPALSQHSLYKARCVPAFLIKHQFHITVSRQLSSPGNMHMHHRIIPGEEAVSVTKSLCPGLLFN